VIRPAAEADRRALPPPEAVYGCAFQVAVLDTDVEPPRGRVVYIPPSTR